MYVVNLRRHAVELFDTLKKHGLNAFCISDLMCPLHRQGKLREIRSLLASGVSCHIAATQCIELGVNIAVQWINRAFAPLSNIIQISGRGNRHGLFDCGVLVLFEPAVDHPRLPPGLYEEATKLTKYLLKLRGLDIQSEKLCREYFELLYDVHGQQMIDKELAHAIEMGDFVRVARLFRVIDDRSVKVLVKYNESKFDELRERALKWGINCRWMREASPHSVNIPYGAMKNLGSDALKQLCFNFRGKKDKPSDWYSLENHSLYDLERGLIYFK
jgi:CRISPR/Cas system-associated endonuclease/helicase Cas3